MCKIFLLSVILSASLSLSFSTIDSNCEEKKDLYELKLNKYDSDVVKFSEDGWEKLVVEGRTKGATSRGNLYVNCARVQVIGNERRYTILVKYFTNFPDDSLYCTIFVRTNRPHPLFISCYKGLYRHNRDSSEQEPFDMYYYFYGVRQRYESIFLNYMRSCYEDLFVN